MRNIFLFVPSAAKFLRGDRDYDAFRGNVSVSGAFEAQPLFVLYPIHTPTSRCRILTADLPAKFVAAAVPLAREGKENRAGEGRL